MTASAASGQAVIDQVTGSNDHAAVGDICACVLLFLDAVVLVIENRTLERVSLCSLKMLVCTL
jgi:uncharacterized membrane protein